MFLLLLAAGATAVVGATAVTVANNITKKDEYTTCVKVQINKGIPAEEAIMRCKGLREAGKEPSIIEKSITPLIVFTGIAIVVPPLIEAMRKK